MENFTFYIFRFHNGAPYSRSTDFVSLPYSVAILFYMSPPLSLTAILPPWPKNIFLLDHDNKRDICKILDNSTNNLSIIPLSIINS